MTRRLLHLLAALSPMLTLGCSCTSPSCDDCVDAAAIDAAASDGATHDGGRDGGRDASGIDAFASDAFASDAFASDAFANDAAVVCDRPGYPVDSTATHGERDAVDTAAAAFTTSTGVTVELDATTAAVTGFSAPFPVTLDGSITDPCARALDAIQHFIASHDTMMRMPPDMMMRACSYDSVTDAEIVRIHGGTYDGRRLIGVDNDLVIHVTRSGTIRFWGGSYLPVTTRLFPQPCLDGPGLESSVVGDSLHYMHFDACVPGTVGSIVIRSDDMRTAGESSLYVDAAGLIHVARRIEVLLLASHVTPSEEGSDLYCCGSSSLDGCVGNYLIVDEISGAILEEQPRCITC